jgi:hypothetical protein
MSSKKPGWPKRRLRSSSRANREVAHSDSEPDTHRAPAAAPTPCLPAEHLAHGDTLDECAASGGECLCSEPLVWDLSPDDGLSCAFTGKGGAISVCTPDGEPTCVALSGDGIVLPPEDCAGCLPATLDDAVVHRCSQVPHLLGF